MQSTLASGNGEVGQFVAAAEERLANALGFRPFHGTLNLDGATANGYQAHEIEEVGDDYCDGVHLRDCRIVGVRAAVVRPMVPDSPSRKTEVVAPVRLRTLFGLELGD